MTAFISSQPPGIGVVGGQSRLRSRVRHFDDADALAYRKRNRGLSGREGADDDQCLIVLCQLLRSGRSLARIAAGVEFHQLHSLARDTALGVDLVDCDIDGGLGRFADRLEHAGLDHVQSDDNFVRGSRQGGGGERRCDAYRGPRDA